MAEDTIQFTVRGPKRWEAELDDLIPDIAGASPFTEALVGKVKRSAALRAVIEEGLQSMRARRTTRVKVETPDP